MKTISKAWAIKMHIPGHPEPNFMGIFYGVRGQLLPCQDGMRTCLFRTRKKAREMKRHVMPDCRPMVVRVDVEIREKITTGIHSKMWGMVK